MNPNLTTVAAWSYGLAAVAYGALAIYLTPGSRGGSRRLALFVAVALTTAWALLNLAGVLTPGPKLAALTGNRLLYRGGLPVALLAGGEVQFLVDFDAGTQWEARKALLRGAVPASLIALS